MLKLNSVGTTIIFRSLCVSLVCLPLAGCMTAEDPWGEGSLAYTADEMYPIAARKPCGQNMPDLGTDYSNHFAPNHGCAVHRNIAALVADPSVLKRPKKPVPMTGDTAVAAINAMNQNAIKSTTTSNGSSSSSGSSTP